MNKILTFLERVLQPISCIIFFGLEVWVIFSFFSDLPGQDSTIIFWKAAAFVVTSFHLYLIINIKTQLNNKSLLVIPLSMVYLFVLGVFFLSSITFSLKSIEKKAYSENIASGQNQFIINTIQYNEIAISKYNDQIEKTSNIYTIMKWRNQITELQDNNSKLYSKITTKTNAEVQEDAFTLLSKKTGRPRGVLIFWFLISLWILFEVGLIMTAPLLSDFKTDKQPENKKKEIAEKEKFNITNYVKENKYTVINFIKALIQDGLIVGDDVISKLTEINVYNCRKCRYCLQNIERDGKTLIESTRGKSYPNFTQNEMLDTIDRMTIDS